MIGDCNAILRAYLVSQASLTALVGGANPRISQGRLPENCIIPAITFEKRGGTPCAPNISRIVAPSFQIKCWADNLITSNQIYRKLFDILHGARNEPVIVGGNVYYLESAQEEVQGQDLQDVDIPNYFYTLAFFQTTIQVE